MYLEVAASRYIQSSITLLRATTLLVAVYNLGNIKMILQGLIRTIRDPNSGYTLQGIAHNDYELSVLVQNMQWQLRHDFGPNYDVSQLVIS